MTPVRRGTPEAALRAIRPELAGAMSESQTVDVAETVIGGPPVGSEDGDGTGGDGTSAPATGDASASTASDDEASTTGSSDDRTT